MHLSSNRSRWTSKCGKNISDTLGYRLVCHFLFLPQFDVICDLLLDRCTATWNLFVNLIRRLVNIIGRFKIMHLFETHHDFYRTKMLVTVFFQKIRIRSNILVTYSQFGRERSVKVCNSVQKCSNFNHSLTLTTLYGIFEIFFNPY